MRFRIHVAERETGEESTLELDAANVQEVRRQISEAGYLISKIEPLAESVGNVVVPTLAKDTASVSDDLEAKVASELQRTGNRLQAMGVYRALTGSGYVAALDYVKALEAKLGANQSSRPPLNHTSIGNDSTDENRKLNTIAIVGFLLGMGIGYLFAGCIGMAVGSVCGLMTSLALGEKTPSERQGIKASRVNIFVEKAKRLIIGLGVAAVVMSCFILMFRGLFQSSPKPYDQHYDVSQSYSAPHSSSSGPDWDRLSPEERKLMEELRYQARMHELKKGKTSNDAIRDGDAEFNKAYDAMENATRGRR